MGFDLMLFLSHRPVTTQRYPSRARAYKPIMYESGVHRDVALEEWNHLLFCCRMVPRGGNLSTFELERSARMR